MFLGELVEQVQIPDFPLSQSLANGHYQIRVLLMSGIGAMIDDVELF